MSATGLNNEKNDKQLIWKRSRGWIRIGEDPTDLAELDKSCFKKAWREESFSKLMNYPWFRVWTWHAEVTSKALAFLIIEDQSDLFSILRVGVIPEYQRQGIGREMIKEEWKYDLKYASNIGFNIHTLNSEQREAWKTALKPAIDKIVSLSGPKGKKIYQEVLSKREIR